MLGAMRCSRWWALLARMISMRQIPRTFLQRRGKSSQPTATVVKKSILADDQFTRETGPVLLRPRLELSAALSASLRDEFLRQIERLGAAEAAALWAQRNLAA